MERPAAENGYWHRVNPGRPGPSKLHIATQALFRLIKEEQSYHKELKQQKQRVERLKADFTNGVNIDENSEYTIRQEVCARLLSLPIHLFGSKFLLGLLFLLLLFPSPALLGLCALLFFKTWVSLFLSLSLATPRWLPSWPPSPLSLLPPLYFLLSPWTIITPPSLHASCTPPSRPIIVSSFPVFSPLFPSYLTFASLLGHPLSLALSWIPSFLRRIPQRSMIPTCYRRTALCSEPDPYCHVTKVNGAETRSRDHHVRPRLSERIQSVNLGPVSIGTCHRRDRGHL